MLKKIRRKNNAVGDIVLGAVAGYLGSRAMDRATGWYFGRQGEASRRREEEVAPGGAPVLAGRKLAGMAGRDVTDGEAARIGAFVHRSLGVTYGVSAAALARAGMPPLRAGLLTGTAAFLLVDEGIVGTAFTPPPWAYPVESHVRGAVGHLAYGAATGAVLAAARRLGTMGS